MPDRNRNMVSAFHASMSKRNEEEWCVARRDGKIPDSVSGNGGHKYRIYGLVVESALPLTSVEACDNERAPAVTIVHARDDFLERWAGRLRRDCEEWIRHTVLADGSIYMKVNGVFEAIIASDGRRVASCKLGAVDDRTFEANLVNFALTTSLTLQGEECLHATVVTLGERAIGLLGPSGSGKSTLSAFLLTQGASLVTDDLLRVTFARDQIVPHPGPRRLKLFDDSAQRLLPDALQQGSFNRLSGKTMFEPREALATNARGTPLSALVWLDDEPSTEHGSSLSVRRLTGVERVKMLTRSTMDIRYCSPERLERQLRFAERIARTVPIFALRYPRNYAALPQVAEALQGMIAA